MNKDFDDALKEISTQEENLKNEKKKLKKRALDEIYQIVEKIGLTPEEVYKALTPTAAKYRDPATGKTWTGKGMPPTWFKKWKADGNDPKELLI